MMRKRKPGKINQGDIGFNYDTMPSDILYRIWAVLNKDPRITVRHIGLYAALICVRHSLGNPNPMLVYSHQIMAAANMVTQSTYHQYIKQLNAFGYLRYEPSFKKNYPSRIYFNL